MVFRLHGRGYRMPVMPRGTICEVMMGVPMMRSVLPSDSGLRVPRVARCAFALIGFRARLLIGSC